MTETKIGGVQYSGNQRPDDLRVPAADELYFPAADQIAHPRKPAGIDPIDDFQREPRRFDS